MEYRQFGRTDLKVSAIGFGCWEISGTYGRIDAAQFERAVHRAIDSGIDLLRHRRSLRHGHLRTRRWRGALGARRPMSASSPRSASAIRMRRTAATAAAPAIMASLDKACAISAPIMSMSISCIGRTSTRRSTRRCVRSTTSSAQGKARYIGVSNFRLAQIEACMRLRRIDVVQYGWNMFDRRMQREIFP